MDNLISPNQMNFLKERMLVDGVVVVNEIVNLSKKYKKDYLIINVNFEKAYDLVSGKFMDYMLIIFEFNEKWKDWMRVCVFTNNLVVLVNGCPTQEISIQIGLEQGNPLVPLIFLLVAGRLNGLVCKAEEIGLYSGFKVGSSNWWYPVFSMKMIHSLWQIFPLEIFGLLR